MTLAQWGRLLWRRRARVARVTVGALLGIVVLQNLEPTSIDLLFWSVQDVPKLILILASMGVGVVLYALWRR